MMYRMFKRLYLVFLVMGMCSAWKVGAGTDMWRIELSLSKKTFIEREPIAVKIEHRNVSTTPRAFFPKKPSAINVSFNGDGPKKYYYFETLAEQVEDLGVLPITIQPQQTHLEEYWLLLGKTNLRNDWEFLFEKPGSYSVSFLNYNDEKVKFDVVSASNAVDVSGRQLFSVASAALFLGEDQRKDKKKGIKDLQRICSKHDTGKYAPYAALTLASHFWGEKGKTLFDLQKYYQYVNIIIEKHPEHPLVEKAFYMRAKGLNREGKNDCIFECLNALKKRRPKSKYIKIIKTEFRLKKRKRGN